MNSIRQCTAKASCNELCSVDWKHFRKSFLPKIKLSLVNQEADYKLCGIFPHASKSAFFEIKHKNLDALDVLLGSGWDQLLLGRFVTRVTVKVSQRHWEIAILFWTRYQCKLHTFKQHTLPIVSPHAGEPCPWPALMLTPLEKCMSSD